MNRSIALVVLVISLVLSPLARADGFIVINPGSSAVAVPRGHFPFAPLEVTYHRVNVDINDQVATTSVDQEFYNPNPQQLEGTYLFPLPPGAHIDKFSMDINGVMQEAELLPADKARSIYEEIVRKYRDPALLEYAGRDAFKVRIFPIEAQKGKKIKITYTQLLKSDTGMTEYTYPLNTEKFSARPVRDVSVKITLTCNQPLKSVYSPSHTVEIKRDGDKKAVIGFEDKNVRPDTDFKLIYSKTPNPIGIDLLTFRNSPDDGYFLLLASPGMDVKAENIQPKDLCLVLDTSGSMAGKKMEQAKKALSFCLANLSEKDRFEIIRFSTEAEPFFDDLKPADKANVDKAQAFVNGLKPIGGTAISDAMDKALALGQKRSDANKRPYVIVFLTDGQPTIGETNEDRILDNVKAAPGGANTRVFTFGIGTDVNTHLLDKIAIDTHAASQYVLPEEDLEIKLSNFYTKIKEPVLSNVGLAFTGGDIRVTQIYPGALPDLFKGDNLIVFGRYSGKGAAAVKIGGILNGEKKEFVQDVNFADNDAKNAFIPRLWATRRVGFLLDEIRLHGETKELKDEVVRLARDHGIVTPYTAYLILEDERRRGVPVAMQNFRELGADGVALRGAEQQYNVAKDEAKQPALRTGGVAVDNSRKINELKDGFNDQQTRDYDKLAKAKPDGARYERLSSTGGIGGGGSGGGGMAGRGMGGAPATAVKGSSAEEENLGYRTTTNYAQQARVVNGRAFYQNQNVWNDSTAQAKKDIKAVNVQFNSDAYFALLKDHPEAAAWLSLGDNVDVVIEDTLYQVRS
jgi:Ca-activated chloride channel family protein